MFVQSQKALNDSYLTKRWRKHMYIFQLHQLQKKINNASHYPWSLFLGGNTKCYSQWIECSHKNTWWQPTGKVASHYTNSAVYWPISLHTKVSSGLAKRYRFLQQGPDSAEHFCSSFKTTNKHDIISGACPTCASWLRCAGLVGCHGYPPQTFWWAPRVRWDGREGGRLSPRPLHRTDWRRTGNRSQRAPSQNLRGDERRQTPGQRARPQRLPCSADAAASMIHTESIVCLSASWTSSLPTVSQTPHADCVPMRGHSEASFPLTLFALC